MRNSTAIIWPAPEAGGEEVGDTLCLGRETKFGGGVEPAGRDEAADPDDAGPAAAADYAADPASSPCDPDAGRDEGEAVRYFHRRPPVRKTASFQIAACHHCYDQAPQCTHSVVKDFF